MSPVSEMTEVHGSNTLGRKKSRIPTAKQNNNRVNRSVSEPDLGTDSVDERLETLLHLLGGARQGGGRNVSQLIPPEMGVPGQGGDRDTLQYLSQLEMVARKLKHQLIKQKQVRESRS